MRTRGAAILLVAAALLSGCASDPLAEQYRSGSGKGYIAGDGTVETFPAEERKSPDEFGGETVDGGELTSAELAGSVTVLNFWYASCPPCRVEAPDLEELNQEFTGDGVRFVGVNVRDEAGTASSFETDTGVTYPSILDFRTADVQLAFSTAIPPNAVPTTLVLDEEGRIAARILGQVTEPGILRSIITDTLAEGDPAP